VKNVVDFFAVKRTLKTELPHELLYGIGVVDNDEI
jgi:hypothetical protein